MTSEFSPSQLALLRQTKKSACVLLVMQFLGRPVAAKEISAILDLDEHTTASYLRQLSRLHLVFRLGYRQGYILINYPQMLLGEDPNVKNSHFLLTTINTIGRKREIEAEVIVDSGRNVKKSHFLSRASEHSFFKAIQERRNSVLFRQDSIPRGDPAVVQALDDAGICEPKRSQLAALPYLTPDYVRLWEAYLSEIKRERYTPGLLIHVLEQGGPLPKTNSFRHLKSCTCAECTYYRNLICPDCHQHPCDCEVEQEANEDE